jgi:hypothetical protein
MKWPGQPIGVRASAASNDTKLGGSFREENTPIQSVGMVRSRWEVVLRYLSISLQILTGLIASISFRHESGPA